MEQNWKVVAVTSQPPWPLDSGGHLRTYHLLRSIAQRFPLTLVYPEHDDRSGAREALAKAGIQPAPAPVSGSGPLLEAAKLARTRLRGEPYVMYGRHYYGAVARELNRLARGENVVAYLDHLDSAGYFESVQQVPTVVDMHNCYSLLAERAAADHRWPMSSFLLGEAARLRTAEERAARSAGLLYATSEREQAYFQGLGAQVVEVVPNGVDVAKYGVLPVERAGTPTILCLGALSWTPNADAAQFMAESVMPVVRGRIPEARLVIVGKDPTPRVQALSANPGVTVPGHVPDVMPYLREATILAVPLTTGGGTRLKILEAFAAGIPVVSTAVGVEGIAAEPGADLCVSERDRFAEEVTTLLLDAPRRVQLATAARELVRRKYDWNSVGAHACAALERLTRR